MPGASAELFYDKVLTHTSNSWRKSTSKEQVLIPSYFLQVTGVMTKKQILESKVTEKIDLVDSDSEEEETVILDKV